MPEALIDQNAILLPKPDLVGLNRDGLAAALEPHGLKGYRVGQIWQQLYRRGAPEFDAMTTIGKAVRADMNESFQIGRLEIASAQVSKDGTRKWLFKLADGALVETVFIPQVDRGTLCISSQIGCTLNCRFCHTGTQRLVRNLTAAELLGQIMTAKDQLDDWPAPKPDRKVTNIVLMGMGEPLYNFKNVKHAMLVALDGEGLGFSKRRITLSTAGVVPMIKRAGAEIGVNLAISLHATNDEIRDRIVPINKKYPIAELLEACRTYPTLNNARRITFEYVMLKDVNDLDEHAHALADMLQDIPSKLNLIPFNAWPGSAFERSTSERINRFAGILMDAGYPSPIRTPRGEDILAACGQLKSETEKARRARPGAAAAALVAEQDQA
ncbi:MAG: 23S rRNA (adenine(2503)-C(2))-methyltransferase RlmN [Alphaproteobacteria bacterium]|jgi:23S rRNA (adenine2503-C2)-methyltransferase